MNFFKILLGLIAITFTIYAKDVNANNFNNTINSNRVVVVKFWSAHCGVCQTLYPEFEKAKRALRGKALFVNYNYDKGGWPLKKYKIELLPTMIIFKNGKEVSRQLADPDAEWIIAWVENNLK